jgi:uncharacterized protein YjeT (DUF2065 family)
MPKLTKDQLQTRQELRKLLILGVGALAIGLLIIFEPFITASTYNTKSPELNVSSPHAWGLVVIGVGMILLYRFIRPSEGDNNHESKS